MNKRLNRKGFTLIELLAVIVILGILLAVAIPAVAKYINSSKKSTYKDNVLSFVRAARQEALINSDKYTMPVNQNEAIVITFEEIKTALDQGGTTSSYGGEFDDDKSFIVIVNDSGAEEPSYSYYVTAIDSKGYGIGVQKADKTVEAKLINSKDLKESNIVQLGTNGGISKPSASSTAQQLSGIDGNITITAVYPKAS